MGACVVVLGLPGEETAPILGREQEQSALIGALDGVRAHGQALLLCGEPGIGKSRLLHAAAAAARMRDMFVLTAIGVQAETHLPFAGLHQLLRPVRTRAGDLPAFQQATLNAAFGVSGEQRPEQFQIAMAVLDLCSDIAADRPLLIAIEDAQWLDAPTLEILGFVARRIESDPIVLVAAVRDGYPSPLTQAGLKELRLTGLDDAAAGVLLETSAPDLSGEARRRVLQDSAGNPLALLELPASLSQYNNEAQADPELPLTQRLENAFAARVYELSPECRTVLMAAALNDEPDLLEVLQASSRLIGTKVDRDVLLGAAEIGIVDLNSRTVQFKHPLIRSAIVQRAGLDDRRRVHSALAEVLSGQPDRRAWHRAALLSGVHEDAALELEQAADRARQRGAIAVAVTALQRAAELSDADSRGRRLVGAARLAVDLGRQDAVVPLVEEAQGLDLDELERSRIMWVEEMALIRPLGDVDRLSVLIDAAERAGAADDRDLQLDLLWLVALRSWWVDPGPEVRAALIEGSRRVGDATAADPRVVAIHAYADPLGHASEVLARLRETASQRTPDVEAARFFGPVALVLGAFDLGTDFLATAVHALRSQGRLGYLPRLLSLYANMAARLGDWEVAIPAADEARRLADEFADPNWIAAADSALSLVAAMRGDSEDSERLAAQAERTAARIGANVTVAFAQFGRVLAGLADGRYADAYAYAERAFNPADPAYHPVVSAWTIADLADAARHVDQLDAARARVAQVQATVGERPGTWIALVLAHAQALVAEPEDAGALYEKALAADLNRWPFQHARIQLAYGQWLRRNRRVSDSRNVLRAARDTFDALGCRTWGEHARRELRASGERSRRRDIDTRDGLTAQELQIAQLAAQGLSNREIGQQLYLSHRTVSTHLYRVFPKLGISSRAELNTALSRGRRDRQPLDDLPTAG